MRKMIKFRIIYFLVTIAIPMISASEKDQQTSSNKNINLYLVPPSGLKPTVYRDSGSQYQSPIPVYPSDQSNDHKIPIQVLKEDQKSYVVHQPNYNVIGYGQTQPKVEFRNPEDPNTKYALEPEGPNHTKVTVKVIKEHKKTFAVDPSYIENHQRTEQEYAKPEIIYKTVDAAYPSSETVYKESNPGVTKYIIKQDEPKEKNVFVKLVEDDKKTYIAEDNQYNNDNTYYQKPEYRKIQTVYKDNEPRYIIKEEEPRQKEIIVKVVNEDKNSFDVDPAYKTTNDETDYRQIVTKYRQNSEPEPNYVKYEVKKEEPKVLVKFVKEERNTFADDSKYKRDNSYLEPVLKKSITDYRKSEPEYRQSEVDFKKYENKDEDQDEKVYVKVLKEEKKAIAAERTYNNNHKYLEPVYKSVTENRKSESDYRNSETDFDKYEDNGNEDKEKKVFVVKEEKKTFEDDTKYENDHKYFEPEYRKSVTEYKKTEQRMSESDSDYDKYVNNKEPREKEVYVKVIKEEKNTFVDEPKYRNDKTYFEPEYRKNNMEYEKTEPEYRKSESEFNRYDEKNRESKMSANENKYFESEYRKSESEFKKPEPEYKQSESEYSRYDDNNEENHAKKVIVKIIKEEEKTFDDGNYDNDHKDENNRKYANDQKYENDRKYDNDQKYENNHKYENDQKYENDHKYENNHKYANDRKYDNDQKYENDHKYDNDRKYENNPKYENNYKHENDRKYDNDQKYENDHKYDNDQKNENDHKHDNDPNFENDHKYMEPDYKKYENEYKKSEQQSKTDDDPNHDVLIKIWSKKSN